MWAFLAFGAGLFQSLRNGLARSLSGKVSPFLNSWSRFAFNLPFSTVVVAILVGARGFPQATPLYYVFCLATGLAQLLGNIALIAAFRHANFAQSILLHKLEIVFTALIGAALFSEYPTPLGWLGIVICASGVILMQLGRLGGHRSRIRFDAGSLLATLAGILMVFASFLLKEATQEMAAVNPRIGEGRFEVALHTLFNVTWMEVVILTAWIYFLRPGELGLVPRHWRRMFWIGCTSFLGSVGWFWAYSIALVAYVKAVGQVEAIVAVVFSIVIWKEREVFRQLPGMALILVGILTVLLGGSSS